MAHCLRCHTARPDGAQPHQPEIYAHTGHVGWYSRDAITYCPACMHALLRGLPPIGLRSPR